MDTKGDHILLDLWTDNVEILNNMETMTEILIRAAKKSGSKILSLTNFKFEPQGLSVVLLVAESHFSVHTYPEKSYASFDAYTCGNTDVIKAVDYIIEIMDPKQWKMLDIKRGTRGYFSVKPKYKWEINERSSNES